MYLVGLPSIGADILTRDLSNTYLDHHNVQCEDEMIRVMFHASKRRGLRVTVRLG
jgi:hypothetical protein